MNEEARLWWEKAAVDFQADAQIPVRVMYGTQIFEDDLQIIGPVAGKHLLEIGCGGAQCGIAFAKQGAIVSGVDFSSKQLEFANKLASEHGVAITFYQHDMTQLPFIGSGSQDIVFSSQAFQYVDDLLACFKEAHRVLKAGGLFVWSVGHPFFLLDAATLRPEHSYFDTGKFVLGTEVSTEPGFAFAFNRRTVSDFFNLLVDAGFTVERMIEPDRRPYDTSDPENWKWGMTPELLSLIPSHIIFKSRKRKK